jgi:hypothetical protein
MNLRADSSVLSGFGARWNVWPRPNRELECMQWEC